MKRIFRHIAGSRAAFTLMEVNLAILIMAVGVLTMTSLYPLGFRENEASQDDVRAAVAADEVLGKLSAALSSRNITWNKWVSGVQSAVTQCKGSAGDGWMAYYRQDGDVFRAERRSTINSKALAVFNALKGACSGATQVPNWTQNDKYAQGLVVQWGKRVVNGTVEDDHSRVSISFRMARRSSGLMAAPMYYTEVHFQGDQEKMEQ